MAREIDQLVLEMEFDNKAFKEAAKDTLNQLKNLDDKIKNMDMGKGMQDAGKSASQGIRSIGDAFKKLDFRNLGKGSKEAFDTINQGAQSVDLSSIESSVERVGNQFSVLGTIGRSALFNLTSAAMNAGKKMVSSVFQPLVQGGFQRAQNVEQAKFMLEGLGADVEAISEAAMNAVKGTAYGFDEAARVASQFFASGITDAGQMETSLLGISGVAAMTSSSYSEVGQIFTTVAGQGRLMSEQLNQFASRGLNVAATLADYYGTTEEEVRDMVTKSKVSFADFQDAMSQAFGEHAKKASETFAGAMSMPRSALARIGADFADPYMEGMKNVFNALAPFIDSIHTALGPVVDIFDNVFGASTDRVVAFLERITAAFGDLSNLDADPPQWLVFLRESGAHIVEQIEKIREAFKFGSWNARGGGPFGDLDFTGAIQGISEFIKSIEVSELMLYNLSKMWEAVVVVFDFVVYVLGSVAAAFGLVGDSIIRYLAAPVTHIIRLITETIKIFLQWVQSTGLIDKALMGVAAVISFVIRIIGAGIRAVALFADQFVYLWHGISQGDWSRSWLSKIPGLTDAFDGIVAGIKGLVSVITGPFRGAGDILTNVFSLVTTLAQEAGGVIVAFFSNLDFSPVTNFFKGIGDFIGSLTGFKNPFSGFSLDFSSAENSIRNVGQSLRDSLSAGEGVKMGSIFTGLIDGVKNFASYVRGLDWEGIFSAIGNGLKTAGKTAAEVGKTIYETIRDFLTETDWAEVGTTIMDLIVRGVKGAVGLVDAFSDMVMEAVSNIDFAKVWEGFKDGLGNIREGITDLFKGMGDRLDDEFTVEAKVDVDTTAIDGVAPKLEAVASGGFLSRIKEIGSAIGSLLSGISTGDFNMGSIIGGLGEGIGSAAAGIAGAIGTLFSAIRNPIATFAGGLKDEVTTMGGEVGGGFFEGLKNAISNINWGDVALGGGALLTGAGFFKISQTISEFTGALTNMLGAVPNAITGVATSLSETITSIGDAAKKNAQGNHFLKMAAGIGILAASLWLLSGIDWQDLLVGGAALAAIGAGMYGLAKGLEGVEIDAGVGIAFIGIAAGLMAFALAIRMFSNIDFPTFVQGILQAGAALAVLVGAVILLSKFGGGGWSLIAAAAAIGMLSGSLFLLGNAVRLFNTIDSDTIFSGLTKIAAVLGVLAVAILILNAAGLGKVGASLLFLAGGLLLMYFAIKQFDNIDWASFGNGILKVAGALAVLVIATNLLKGGGITKAAGTLTLLGGGLIIMYAAIRLFDTIGWGELINGILKTMAAIGLLALSLLALRATNIEASVKPLIMLAGGLLLMYVAVSAFGNMDLGTLAKGMISVGLAIAGMVAFIMLAGRAGAGAGQAALMLTLLAASLVVFSFAIRSFEGVGWDTIGKGLATLAGGLVLLLGAGAVAGIPLVAAGLMTLATTFAIFGGALVLIAGAMWIAVDAFARFVDALSDLAGAIEELGPALRNFVDGGGLSALETMLKMEVPLGGILNLGRALGALSDNVTPELGKSMSDLGKGLAEFENSIYILERLSSLDAGNSKSVGNILNALSENVTPDLGTNLSSLKVGLEDLQDVIPVLQSLMDLSSENGNGVEDLWAIIAPFETRLGEDTGAKIQNFAQGLSALEEVIPILQSLMDLSSTVGDGADDLWAIIAPFETRLGEDTGTKIQNFAQGLTALTDVIPVLQSLMDLSSTAGDGVENLWAILAPFETRLSENTGPKIQSFAQGLSALQDVIPALQSLMDLSSKAGDGVDNLWAILAPFETRLTEETGAKISSFARGLTALQEVIPVMQSLMDLDGRGIGGNGVGPIKNLLEAFQGDFPTDIGTRMASLATGLRSLDGVTEQMESLMRLKGEAGGLQNLIRVMGTIDGSLGSDIQAFADSITPLQEAVPKLKEAIDELASIDTSSIANLGADLAEGLDSGFVDAISGLADSMAGAMDTIVNAIKNKKSAFTSAGRELVNGLRDGFDNTDAIKGPAQAIAEAGAQAVRGKADSFRSAGRALADGLAAGITSGTSAVVSAARAMASDAAAAAKAALDINSPSRVFIGFGNEVANGLARGISNGSKKAEKSSRLMAVATANSAKKQLQINSPSRVFMDMGADIVRGLRDGIDANSSVPGNSVAAMLDETIQAFTGGRARLSDAQAQFVHQLTRDIDMGYASRRLNQLGQHSRAAYATAIKDRNIAQEEEAERAEDERIKVYEDIETTRDRIAELRENPPEAKNDRERRKNQRDFEKAERDHQRAIAARRRYEYQQSGEEAGVAFVEGIAVGLIDESDKIPSYMEFLSEVLYGEFEKIQTELDDRVNLFSTVVGVKDTAKSLTKNFNDLGRAFRRLSNAQSPRAVSRNLDMVLDIVVDIAEEAVGLLGIFSALEPFFPQILAGAEGFFKSIAPMVSNFAPDIGAALAGGITSALPALVGPLGIMAGGLLAFGVILYDVFSGGKVRKLLKGFVESFGTFIRRLPRMLADGLIMLVKALPDIIAFIPEILADLIVAIIDAIVEVLIILPEILPEIILALMEAIVRIITETPFKLIEAGVRIVEALLKGIFIGIPKLLLAIPGMLIDIGIALVEGFVSGIQYGFKAMENAIFKPFNNFVDGIKNLLGIKSPSRVFMGIGEDIVAGFGQGASGMEDELDNLGRLIKSEVDDMFDDDNVIKIDLDAGDAVNEMSRIRNEIEGVKFDIAPSANFASAGTSSHRRGEQPEPSQNITNIEYNQNITTPNALRTIDVYRAGREGMGEIVERADL